MAWTKTLPKKVGWYWVRAKGGLDTEAVCEPWWFVRSGRSMGYYDSGFRGSKEWRSLTQEGFSRWSERIEPPEEK
jgi:hypothetical protein